MDVVRPYQVITDLIDKNKISLVPTREGSKVPLVKWTNEENHNIPALKLHELLFRYGTNSVAAILGTPSGRLVCIDVDTKYKSGFDGTILKDIKDLFPNLWDLLRIEKTPSGGLHILYKVDGQDDLPRHIQAAKRWATDEEKANDPKAGKTRCFLEVKGEGQLSQMYPSDGYQLLKGDFNVLGIDDHNALIALCYTYNEVEDKIETVKLTASESNYYSENPFEHFNKSPEAIGILDRHGWTPFRQDSKRIFYMRPGKTSKEVSASYTFATGLYKIFTNKTELKDIAYTASILLCELEFSGDRKALYHHLVHNGYGKIKPNIENNIIKIRAQDGKPLPKNVSEAGKAKYDVLREEAISKYPYGIFWKVDEETMKVSINRDEIYKVSEGLGFRLFGEEICWINGFTVEIVTERFFFDSLRDYINQDEEDYKEIFNSYESFIQKSGSFTVSRIPLLDRELIIKSTKHESFKAYRNGYLRITAKDAELIGYENFNQLIWKHQMQDRDFRFCEQKEIEESLYFRFLEKATGISDHIYQCIGFYAHDYKSTMTSYIVVLCEMVEDPKNGGGSGKNIFTNLLQYTTSLLNKPGKNVKFDDTMLRTWRGQRVLSLNDVEKKFDFLSLRELSSGEGEVGKKFKQEVVIDNDDMPKFIVNTNFAFDASGPGLKRRLIPIEFTDFFSKIGGVDVYFGKDFPSDKRSNHDWTESDWVGYDNFIVCAIQSYIQNNCKLNVPKLTDGGWIKQFEERFGKLTHQFIRENLNDWLEKQNVEIVSQFNVSYERFCRDNNVHKNFILGSIKMNEALDEYCKRHDIEFIRSKNVKINGIQLSVKSFIKHGNVPQDLYINDSNEEELPF